MGRFFVLVALGLSLASCERKTVLEHIIHNNTRDTIVVHIVSMGADLGLAAYDRRLPPQSWETFYVYDTWGPLGAAQDPSLQLDTFEVWDLSGAAIRKDYRQMSNWEIVVQQVSRLPRAYEHTYRFKVEASDF